MHSAETCANVVAYLVTVGIALELSHRLYWKLSSRVMSLKTSTFVLSCLSAITACIPLTVAVIVTLLFTTFIAHTRLSALGFFSSQNAAIQVMYGAIIGVGCVVIMFTIGRLAGFIKIRRLWLSKNLNDSMPRFIDGLVAFFTGAIFEEVVFRGYLFYILYQHYGIHATIIISSVIFSAAHLFKHRNVPIMFTVNAFIFGILAALCRNYTGALWLPIGLHFGWNIVSGSILGLPYSGKSYDQGIIECDVSGPAWLTGGLHSLDAGALGTIGLLVAAVSLAAIVPIH